MFVTFVMAVIIVNFSTTSSETHVCTFKTKVSGPRGQTQYKTHMSCCLNYYKVNGTCEACPPGTYGSRGRCDKSCPEGRYGQFCSLACICVENERCDAEIGCVCAVEGNCSTDSYTNASITYSTEQESNSTDSKLIATIAYSTEEQSNATGTLYNSNLRAVNETGPNCLEITIVLCSALFSATMLIISTSSFLLIWYIGPEKDITDIYGIC